MTIDFRNYDGLAAIDLIQLAQPTLGTGIESGCDATLPSSASPIAVDITSGSATIAGSSVQVSSGSPVLADGDSQHPRKDLICVDSGGSLVVLTGTPREPKDNTGAPGTDRTVYQPEPPDLSSESSIDAVAPVVEVWVPTNATTTADMNESGVTYLRDRRLPTG